MAHVMLSIFTIFYALAFSLDISLAADECISCASSILQSQWQATGLALHPLIVEAFKKDDKNKRFAFTDVCNEGADADKNLPRAECSDSCIEMLLVTNGVYAIVRGCSSHFFRDDESSVMTGNTECFYNFVTHPISIWEKGTGLQVIQKPRIGHRICRNAVPTTPCNDKLSATFDFAEKSAGKGWETTGLDCQQVVTSGTQCLSCMRTDQEGSCDWNVRTFCKGAFCTKTIGYVNGRWLEIRGCAQDNPFGSDQCVKIEKNSELSLLGDTQAPRTMSIEQCICKTQFCNGANMIKMPNGLMVVLQLASLLLITFTVVISL